MISFLIILILSCLVVLIYKYPNLIIGSPIQCNNGTFLYIYIHENDFVSLKHFEGQYWIGKNIKATEEFRCWGKSKRDAQEKISEIYNTEYSMHPKPIVIKKLLD